MERGADWLAWILQFIVGLVVGAIVGLVIISRGRYSRGIWLDPEQVSTFIFGAALVGAGLASYYGDRLWLGSSYRVIPPDGIKHNETSRMASMVTGLLGGILVLVSLLRHFGVF